MGFTLCSEQPQEGLSSPHLPEKETEARRDSATGSATPPGISRAHTEGPALGPVAGGSQDSPVSPSGGPCLVSALLPEPGPGEVCWGPKAALHPQQAQLLRSIWQAAGRCPQGAKGPGTAEERDGFVEVWPLPRKPAPHYLLYPYCVPGPGATGLGSQGLAFQEPRRQTQEDQEPRGQGGEHL